MAVLSNTGIRAGSSAAAGGGDLTIEKSLIFTNEEGGTYLSRTPSSASNRKTFTWSFWIKKGSEAENADSVIIQADTGNTDSQCRLKWTDSSDLLNLLFDDSGVTKINLVPNRKFHDEHAWMHILVAVDTTQATSSDRAKIYINGQQETSFNTATYPTQNYESQINNNVHHVIGRVGHQNAARLEAKLAEFHHVDGTALDPESFGKYDDTTGVWNPIEYTGAHGTNGFHLDFKDDSSLAAIGYDVSGNNNHFTPYNFQVPNANAPTASGSGNGSDGIQNGWVLGGNFSQNDANNTGAYYTGDLEFIGLEADSGDTFGFFGGTTDSSNDSMTISKKTNDTGDWASIGTFTAGTINNWTNAVSGALCEGTLSAGFTANDRIKISGGNNFLGILRITRNGARTQPLRQNVERSVTNDTPSNSEPEGGDTCAGGELTGNYCQFSNVLGSTAFTGHAFKKCGSIVQGTTGSSNQSSVIGNMGVTSGKWYCEYWIKNQKLKNNAADGQNIIQIGPMMIDHIPRGSMLYGSTRGGTTSGDPLPGSITATYGACGWRWNGNKAAGSWPGSAWTEAGTPTFGGGDFIGMALDMDNGAVYFRKNGTWLNSGDPTSGSSKTGAFHTWTPNPHVPLAPGIYNQNTDEIYLNSGQVPFKNQGPSGYKVWCSQNLPDFSSGDSKNQPNKFFNLVSHSGTDGTSSIDAGFKPGVALWYASTLADNKYLFDQIRGDGAAFYTNSSGESLATGKQSFESSGIEVVNDGTYDLNASGHDYRGMFWYLGESAGTPSTAGSLNPSNSWYNATTGMEIIKRTGDGNNTTVGHNLGVEPTMFWDKKVDAGGNNNWAVYHKYYGGGGALFLDTTDKYSDSANFNSTDATSTVFSVGSGQNAQNSEYITILFTEKPGFSRFGATSGTEDDEPENFCFCGFRPAWVMTLDTETADRNHKQWYMWDIHDNPYRNKRTTVNHMNNTYASTASGNFLSSAHGFTILSNGFCLGSTNQYLNKSGSRYIWAAFAEHPWKIARAA